MGEGVVEAFERALRTEPRRYSPRGLPSLVDALGCATRAGPFHTQNTKRTLDTLIPSLSSGPRQP